MRSTKFFAADGVVGRFADEPHLTKLRLEHLVTTYYDDGDGRCYADQFRKTKRRFKIRLRQVDSRSLLEVKVKGGKGEKLRRIDAAELDAGARAFIREALDDAFEPGFARGVEEALRPVVTTDFRRESWAWAGVPSICVDTAVLLRAGDGEARLNDGLVLIEVLPDSEHADAASKWLISQGAKPVGFSKFGAAADLLLSERVRSHKPQLLREVFHLS